MTGRWHEGHLVARWTVRPDLWSLGSRVLVYHQQVASPRWVASTTHVGGARFAAQALDRAMRAGLGDPGVMEAMILAGWEVTPVAMGAGPVSSVIKKSTGTP